MMPDITPSFGTWLQAMRESLGWTVSKLAERAGLPRSTLATLESRARRGSRPRSEVTARVAGAMGLPVLAVALIAGYFERDIEMGTGVAFGWMNEMMGGNDWWAQQGGAYLRVM